MGPYPLDDTIVAIASPPGGAARAIVRLSGPHVATCVGRLFIGDCPDFYAAEGEAKRGLSPSAPAAGATAGLPSSFSPGQRVEQEPIQSKLSPKAASSRDGNTIEIPHPATARHKPT